MTIINSLFKDLNSSDIKIQKEFENKIQIIDSFLEEIKDICNIFFEVWELEEKSIENKIKDIAKKHSFTLTYGGGDELAFHNIMRDLVKKFPICNDDNEAIIDSLPRTNREWDFNDKSDKKEYHIEVIPKDIYARYPHDPENNPLIFDYIIDKNVHEKLVVLDNDGKKKTIKNYIDMKVGQYLTELENTIKNKSEVINKSLKDIDFNDPQVIAALKSKLNNIR